MFLIVASNTTMSGYCHRCYCRMVSPFVCPSVALVHFAKTVGRSKTPFGRTLVWSLKVPNSQVKKKYGKRNLPSKFALQTAQKSLRIPERRIALVLVYKFILLLLHSSTVAYFTFMQNTL